MRGRASPSGGLSIHNIIITAYCYREGARKGGGGGRIQ